MHLKTFTLILFSMLITSLASANMLPIQSWKTKTGTPVYFVASPSVPMLNLVVQFRAGSSDEGSQYGLATLTNALLAEGTKHLSAQAFSNQVTQLGSEIDTNADKVYSVIALQTLTKSPLFEQSITLLKQAISEPAFRQTAIDRLKSDLIAGRQAQQQNPDTLANLTLTTLLFKNTPYAHNQLGTPQTLETITAKQIRAFYQKFYQQKNAVIFMVGALDQKTAHHIADTLFQALPPGAAHAPIPLTSSITTPVLKKIAFPANQTYIRVATTILNPPEQTRFAQILANHILGGGTLTSLLSQVIREQHGLSYGVSSSNTRLANAQIWAIDLQTKNSTAEKALQLTQKTLESFNQQGANPTQIQAAKSFLVQSLPLRFTNNSQILAAMIYLYNEGLPINFFDTYAKQINAVTNQAMLDVARKALNPKHMVTVMVGGQS